MTIEIQQPEVEALIRQRMESGRFQSVEEAIFDALRVASVEKPKVSAPSRTLEEVFASARGLAEDVDFSRNGSSGRPCDQ